MPYNQYISMFMPLIFRKRFFRRPQIGQPDYSTMSIRLNFPIIHFHFEGISWNTIALMKQLGNPICIEYGVAFCGTIQALPILPKPYFSVHVVCWDLQCPLKDNVLYWIYIEIHLAYWNPKPCIIRFYNDIWRYMNSYNIYTIYWLIMSPSTPS